MAFPSIPTEQEFLDAVLAHLAERGIGESRLGTEVANDPNLVREMRGGRQIRLEMANRISTYLRGRE